MKKLILGLLLGGFVMAAASAKTAVVYFSVTGTTERMAKNRLPQSNATTPKAAPQSQTKSTSRNTTPSLSATQSGGHTLQKSSTHLLKAKTGRAKSLSPFAQAEPTSKIMLKAC